MKVLKILGIIILVLFIIMTTLCTLYFLFANEGYGIDAFNGLFKDGFFAGIKNFFVEIWRGFKYVFKV